MLIDAALLVVAVQVVTEKTQLELGNTSLRTQRAIF